MWTRTRTRLRELWEWLEGEDLPRVAGSFTAMLLLGGIAIYVIEGPSNPQFRGVDDGLWWALVTLTTIGYGDKYPITGWGRIWGGVVVFMGLGMVGTITGKIASVLVERRIKEGRGLGDARRAHGHIVLLGWKREMAVVVEGMLAADRSLTPADLVLVNTADDIANLELCGRFRGLVYLRGDMTDPAALRRANLGEAARVIILADEAGQRSDQETDARTVMAALAVEKLAPDVYMCVELLEKEYAEQISLARCDEVILSRDYTRSVLVGSAVTAGLSRVLELLLGADESQRLRTEPIPERFVGRPWSEYVAHLAGEGGRLPVGILEQTGKASVVKRAALREAQKTATVGELLTNLQQVKAIEVNNPRLNPPADYVIPGQAQAIVIGAPVRSA